ncbi:MAG: HAD-IIIC family phosphatase [Bacteroidota bacterium]
MKGIIDFNILKRNLKKDVTGFKKIKIAILADFASQLLTQAIRAYGIGCNIDYEVFEADYNQIDRQIFDPSSELYEFNPDYIVIFRSSERLLKQFYKQDSREKEAFAENQVDYIDSLYQTITNTLKSKVIINTHVEINDNVFGNYSGKTRSSFIYQIKKLNILLMDLSQKRESFYLSDIASVSAKKGYDNIFDPKIYVNADMVFSIDFLPYIAKNIHDTIQAISGTFKKCLILDLDNIIWGGIIGDDGMEGIQLGELGIGKVFSDLQLWVKALRKRGIVIAVCSKNTEEIAKEAFISHPNMVLKLDDIAVFVSNWENKVDNIKYIQGILNIGFDSMVFLDDNPFERNMVQQGIPDITVPSLPEDPAEYILFLRDLNLFETASYTEEDEVRTKQYQEEAKRKIVQKNFANEEEFLQSLNMKSDVKAFDAFTNPRISQLSQRSNQFNLRTIRYSEQEVREIATSGEYVTFSFTLEDIYGDYGLVAYVILHKRDAYTLFIDSWVMSCRVLNRGMESFTLNKIVELAKQQGFRRLVGEYIPTKKNELVKDNYLKLGFTELENNIWELPLQNIQNAKIVFIQKK